LLLNKGERKGEVLKRYTETEKSEILKEVQNLGTVRLVAKKHAKRWLKRVWSL